MKIGLQVSSLKKYLETPEDVLETFKKVKAIGYNRIQIEFMGEAVSVESVKESLDKSGLVCVGTQDMMFDNLYENINTIIKRNILWQAKYASASVIVPSEETEIAELAEKLNDASRKLNENGMILEMHPLFASYVIVNNAVPLDMLWERIDDKILLQPDFAHVIRGEANPINLIEKYAGRIDEIHCKDYHMEGDNFILTPIGQGIIPYKEIVESCKKHGVKYCWAEQEAWDKDAFECMKESFDFLVSCGLEA